MKKYDTGKEKTEGEIMSVLREHPIGSCYALMGALSFIIGVMTTTDFIVAKNLTVSEVFGFAIMFLSILLLFAAGLVNRMDQIEAQLRKHERDLQQDLQQKERS